MVSPYVLFLGHIFKNNNCFANEIIELYFCLKVNPNRSSFVLPPGSQVAVASKRKLVHNSIRRQVMEYVSVY
jgi:hypothetical protein